jgi:hypothetical protein
MSRIFAQPGNVAQWQALVHDAAQHSGIQLDEELESYLVFTLMRYLRRPDMAQRIMALDFLDAMQQDEPGRSGSLRDVGDQCLLYSGLFPRRAERRRVRAGYYVELGRSAYQNLADSLQNMAHLFARLAEDFVTAMDALQSIRVMADQSNGLTALQSYELWEATDSRIARQALGLNITPLRSLSTQRH